MLKITWLVWASWLEKLFWCCMWHQASVQQMGGITWGSMNSDEHSGEGKGTLNEALGEHSLSAAQPFPWWQFACWTFLVSFRWLEKGKSPCSWMGSFQAQRRDFSILRSCAGLSHPACKVSLYSFFFNWSIVDLLSCVSFRCTARWFGYITNIHMYIYKEYVYPFSYSLFSMPPRCWERAEESLLFRNEVQAHQGGSRFPLLLL